VLDYALATEVIKFSGGPQGLFYAGGFTQLGEQALAALVVGLYAFTVSYAVAKLIDRVMGFRLSAEDEKTGVDFTQHAETAYAEGVHGYQPSRRPSSFGDFGVPRPHPEAAEEG
jgi:ammonium transporter, Amt family